MSDGIVRPEEMAARRFAFVRGTIGAGKIPWARRFAARQEIWKTAQHAARLVQRLAGLEERGPWTDDPETFNERQIFRAPHHSVSLQAMTGCLWNGFFPCPGELSLAHGGTLLLDEAAEFRSGVVEAVIAAVRLGSVTIETQCAAPSWQRLRLPACFSLVVSSNPCPCGWYGHPSYHCECGEVRIAAYREKTAKLERLVRELGGDVVELDPASTREVSSCI